ncbi:unnamed protein product [Somion occarium]|uniref:Uncharacterized protein n=1 Tax=Somion occarium TaxID=3059160 RepID=A0ABP1CII3_9APHY
MPVYAVQWLDRTFRSRARAEELLRPDLEEGLITEHDYNLAVSFLPGHHRYFPYVYGAGTTTAYLAYGKYGRRWSLKSPRMYFGSLVATFFGLVWGQLQRAKAHWNFAHELENPTNFAKALQNVNYRTGGTQPLGWTLPGAQAEAKPAGEGQNVEGQPNESGWASEPHVVTDTPDQTSNRPPSPTPSRPRSRWEEIRAANTRGTAHASSWDAVRQQHERERILERRSSSSTPGDDFAPTSSASRYSDQDRDREQARFEALLEMERKMSRS